MRLRKEKRRREAAIRNARWAGLTPQQQLGCQDYSAVKLESEKAIIG